jgi:hypothetical protein
MGAAFLLLTINEGKSTRYQSYIDLAFHTWPLMAAATTALWLARRDRFGSLPRLLRGIATILLPFFALFTFFALVGSPLVWTFLQPLGMSRSQIAPVAVVVGVACFIVAVAWLLMRGFFRMIGGKYQHHGIAVGLGPIYLYFRKRRSQ